MVHPIVSVAKKEILDNIRNFWLILVTLIFTTLVFFASWAGSLNQSWANLGILISQILAPIVHAIAPIIGLILGYSCVVGELEAGSLPLLASHAISRTDILFGKLIGRGFILLYSIVFGFGLGVFAIAFNVPDADYGAYGIFIAATILLSFVFFCLGVFISTLFRRRSIAMMLSLGVWVVFIWIWPLITTIMIFSLYSSFLEKATLSFSIPTWFYIVDLFSPVTVYDRLITLTISPNLTGDLGAIPIPSFYSAELMVGLLMLWIGSVMVCGLFRFHRMDI
ncbi:MAG: ABC transporter permease [Candidatus Thermoplasmatota archaeon]|nr:ABC transporter permease [Candidatus Thermoplasmatota archaeon]MBU1942024.1 ABC transporter permease [Candidatus Thermoplasmatota archaeon]